MLAVEPRSYVLAAKCSLALRNFVFVVRKDVVHATGMEVDLPPEIARDHRRALDVPAGEAVAPGAGPLEHAARLSGLPQGEVALVAL